MIKFKCIFIHDNLTTGQLYSYILTKFLLYNNNLMTYGVYTRRTIQTNCFNKILKV